MISGLFLHRYGIEHVIDQLQSLRTPHDSVFPFRNSIKINSHYIYARRKEPPIFNSCAIPEAGIQTSVTTASCSMSNQILIDILHLS